MLFLALAMAVELFYFFRATYTTLTFPCSAWRAAHRTHARFVRFIYLLMHACLGGELWSHLREKGRLDDNATRFYSASVIEGISYLHGMVSAHGNLNPSMPFLRPVLLGELTGSV